MWYLKFKENQVYGPIDKATLIKWAFDGRIPPNSKISKNKQYWLHSETLEELEINWYILLEDNSVYGPINISTIKTMIDDDVATWSSIAYSNSHPKGITLGEIQNLVNSPIPNKQAGNARVLKQIENLTEVNKDFVKELENKNFQITALNEQIYALQNHIDMQLESKNDLDQLESQNKSQQEQITLLDKELATLKADINAIEQEKQKLEHQQNSITKDYKALEESNNILQKTNTTIKNNLSLMETDLSNEKTQEDKLKTINKTNIKHINELSQLNNTLQKNITTLKIEVQNLTTLNNNKANQILDLNRNIKDIEQTLKEKEKEICIQNKQFESIQQTVLEHKNLNEKLSNEIKESDKQLKSTNKELEKNDKELEKLNKKLNKAEMTITEKIGIIEQNKKNISDVKSELQENIKQIDLLKSQKKLLEQNIELQKQTVEILENKQKKSVDENKILDEQNKSCKQTINTLNNQIQKTNNEIQNLNQEIEQLKLSLEVEIQRRLQAQIKEQSIKPSDTIIDIDHKGNAKETIVHPTPETNNQNNQRKSHLESLEESAQQEILAWMQKQKLKKKK